MPTSRKDSKTLNVTTRTGLAGRWLSTPSTVAGAIAAILSCAAGPTFAADAAAADTASTGTDSLEEVVVTATAASTKKLDASYNVVTADAELIKDANPKSTADLLKLAPGIWPESSGGQTGANIEIAGFPGGGDAPFFTNMIEGSPMYGMPSLSFMDSSSLFRLDDTVERVEIVQGGPGAVFGPGQMGATANFILKRGTDTPSGTVALTYGSEGLFRADGFYGFKITDGWYGSVGGFWRESDGVRDPQFKADVGGQLTATLSHDIEGGSILFYFRALDDKNQFIVPIPLIQNGNNYSNYPGFNALKSSFGSYAIENVVVPNPNGGFENADLANGRGASLKYFGGSLDKKFDEGWTLKDTFLFDGGSLPTNALFSGPNPRPLSYYLYGCQVAQPAGYCAANNTPVDTNNLGTNGAGLPLSYNVNAQYLNGTPVSMNQNVITQGWWYIQKNLRNFSNDLRVSKDVGGGNTLTGGLYLARYTDDDNWSLGNTMLMTATPNAQPIILNYQLNGATYNLTSPQGFVNENNNYNIVEHGEAQNVAVYLSDTWKYESWLADLSGRYENIDANQRTCNRSAVQMGSQYDLWDNAVPLCNGTWDFEHYVNHAESFTAGVNYEFNKHMSAYVRVGDGTHFDDFDNGIRGAGGNFAPVQTVKNIEVGYKLQTSFAYVDLNVYHKEFTGLQYQETDAQGNPLTAISTYGAKTNGLNFVGDIEPFHNFNIRLVGDYMDGSYDNYNGCAQYINIYGATECIPLNGKPLQRQPKVQFRLTPSYKIGAEWGDVTGWVTYEYVGQRYEDQSGLQPLGTYYMLGGGITAHVGTNWEFRVQGTNLTNQIGLTEGNSRVFGVNTGVGGVIMARPIEGREINLQARYKF